MDACPTVLVALASIILLIPTVAAQTQDPPRPTSTPTQAESAQPREGASAENADLSITARVTARELIFRKVPNPKVEFTGKPARQTLWTSERENIPERVQPGITYRDIGITLRITSVFADIDRIVAEALGEIPTSEAAPPAQPSSNASTLAPTSPAAAPANAPKPRTRQRAARRGTRR